MTPMTTQCCIAGGGPAGMMLGLLLARAGVKVVVLEKHADFRRDFRGDTVHPSTLDVIGELGYIDEFLKIRHQERSAMISQFGETRAVLADFSRLPGECKFEAIMAQWDFLNFLARKGAGYPCFSLIMNAEATRLIERDGKVSGVSATTPDGPLEVSADLTVAADGRHSVLRSSSGLESEDFGAPMDVLWFSVSRRPDDPDQPLGHFDKGFVFILVDRGDYWQSGFVIPKGSADRFRAEGIEAFRAKILALAPFLGKRVDELASWDDVKTLFVKVDCMKTWWKPGFLCIGDAAHAMSPIVGVGINMAVQDAVAAANILAQPLSDGRVEDGHLRAVQTRRKWSTRIMQRIQAAVQNRIVGSAFDGKGPMKMPMLMRVLTGVSFLAWIPTRLIGYGVLPEHVAVFIRRAAPEAVPKQEVRS